MLRLAWASRPNTSSPSLPLNLPQHPAGPVSVLDTIRPRRLLPADPLGAAAAGTSAPPLFAASQTSSDAQTGLGSPPEHSSPLLPPNLPQHPAGSVSVLDTILPRRLLPADPLGAAAAGTSAPPLFAASQPSSDAQTGLGSPPEHSSPLLPPNLPQHPAGSVSVLDTILPRRLLPADPLGAAAAGTPAPPLFAASQTSSDAQTGLGSPPEHSSPLLPLNLPQHPAGPVSVLDTTQPRRLSSADPLGATVASTPALPLVAASQTSSDTQTGLVFPPERSSPSLPLNLPQHPAGPVSVLDTTLPRRSSSADPLGVTPAAPSVPAVSATSRLPAKADSVLDTGRGQTPPVAVALVAPSAAPPDVLALPHLVSVLDTTLPRRLSPADTIGVTPAAPSVPAVYATSRLPVRSDSVLDTSRSRTSPVAAAFGAPSAAPPDALALPHSASVLDTTGLPPPANPLAAPVRRRTLVGRRWLSWTVF